MDHMEERAKIDGAYLAIAVCGILINGFGAMFLGVSSISRTKFSKSRFAEVNSHTNPSMYHLLLLI